MVKGVTMGFSDANIVMVVLTESALDKLIVIVAEFSLH